MLRFEHLYEYRLIFNCVWEWKHDFESGFSEGSQSFELDDDAKFIEDNT